MPEIIDRNKATIFSAVGGAVFMLIITLFIGSLPAPWVSAQEFQEHKAEFIEHRGLLSSQYATLITEIAALKVAITNLRGDIIDNRRTIQQDR